MEIEKKTNIALLLDFYSTMLTERQSEVMQLYYGEDLSLSEVAEITGITRQGARDAIKKSESILISCEEKLGLYQKHLQQSVQIKDIISELRSATNRNDIDVQIECIKKLLL